MCLFWSEVMEVITRLRWRHSGPFNAREEELYRETVCLRFSGIGSSRWRCELRRRTFLFGKMAAVSTTYQSWTNHSSYDFTTTHVISSGRRRQLVNQQWHLNQHVWRHNCTLGKKKKKKSLKLSNTTTLSGKFLETHISSSITWSLKTTAAVQKAQQSLHLLRRGTLRKTLPPPPPSYLCLDSMQCTLIYLCTLRFHIFYFYQTIFFLCIPEDVCVDRSISRRAILFYSIICWQDSPPVLHMPTLHTVHFITSVCWWIVCVVLN